MKQRTCLLEVRTDSGNFMDKVFDTKNVIFAELFLNCGVGGDRNALLVDLAVPTLVD